MNELSISSNLLKNFSGNFKGKKVLITGGTKFLGQRLKLAFEETGRDLTIIGSKECDLRDQQKALDLFAQKFDIVIHAAAVQGGLGYILSHPTEIYLDNLKIHANVIEACRQFPPQKLIGIGSSCSYPGGFSDMKEEDFWNGRLDESVFTYGFTKKVLFVGQYSLFKQFKIKGAHLVLNNMYGPHDNYDPSHAHVIADLIRKFHEAKKAGSPVSIWGDGSAEREFLYVDDAVEGILRALLHIDGFELVNIANGQPVQIKKLVSILSEVFDYQNVEFDTSKPTGALRKGLNPTKCQQLLDWSPPTELLDGIKKAYQFYQESVLVEQ